MKVHREGSTHHASQHGLRNVAQLLEGLDVGGGEHTAQAQGGQGHSEDLHGDSSGDTEGEGVAQVVAGAQQGLGQLGELLYVFAFCMREGFGSEQVYREGGRFREE